MPLKYTCSFVLSREKDRPDAPLRCRIRWSSSRYIVSLNVGYRVNPDRWVAKAQRCAPGSFHSRRRIPASIINREVERFEAAAAAVCGRLDDGATEADVRNALRVELGIDTPCEVSVSAAMTEFCRDGVDRLSWGASTPAKFRALRHHLERWHKDLDWSDFSTDGLTSWLVFLRDGEELRNSTIEKQLAFLKWFLKWCAGKGYIHSRDYETFRPHLKNTQRRVIFLAWEELMKVWGFVPPKGMEHLEKARDIFLFCAFTSLRYSDAMNLRWSDVEPHSIRVTTIKTADSLVIDLNRWSDEILGRYVDEAYGDYVFPRIANQRMNLYLKIICELCGIDEPVRMTHYRGSERIDEVFPKYKLVGTHCARRTFICNALMMGISPTTVMAWTGHSDFQAMKPYIAIADDARAKAMALFDQKKRD